MDRSHNPALAVVTRQRKTLRPMVNDDVVISLFSGAGGFATSFSQAGLKPLFGVDINADACKTCQYNVGTPCHQLDLSMVEPIQLARLAGTSQPFAVIGSPLCQGFSTAGSRNANDPRNQLIFNCLNIVANLRPRWFISENFEGLLTSCGGKNIARLVREFVDIGYSIRLQKVNFDAYGVPQTRQRLAGCRAPLARKPANLRRGLDRGVAAHHRCRAWHQLAPACASSRPRSASPRPALGSVHRSSSRSSSSARSAPSPASTRFASAWRRRTPLRPSKPVVPFGGV